MDLAQNDLVLHEGDGKIQLPIKTSLTKSGLKVKKMPSPRKVTTPSTTTAKGTAKKQSSSLSVKGATKEPTAASTSKGGVAKKKIVDTDANSSTPHIQKPEDKNDKPIKADYVVKVKKSKSEGLNSSFDGDSDDGDSMVFEDWNDEVHREHSFQSSSNHDSDFTQQESHHFKNPSLELTSEDIEICRRLDDEYERALEERDIGYNARYSSVRQTAVWSVFFLALYMLQGTFVYRELLLLNNERLYNFTETFREEGFNFTEDTEFDTEFSHWSIPESLLFSVFTITTVGYGREDLPTTPSFQAYTIFYILVGIAALTIMVAQIYQCMALEASRARLSQDKQDELRRRSGLMIKGSQNKISSPSNSKKLTRARSSRNSEDGDDLIITSYNTNTGCVSRTVDSFFRRLDRAKYFFRETELGKGISVIFPFVGLILSGALVVYVFEKWTFLESVYFAVVSLTTVGFGDYVPTKLPSIWFCILWLPFSIGFMSMYLANVAAFYIRLSDRNIRRIERHLRRRLQKAKEKAEEERAEILKRAYRGQEIEIEIAAGGPDADKDKPLRSQRSESMDSNESEEFQHATIPKSHATSVMKRKKREGFNILPTMDDGENSDDETVLIDVATASQNTKLSNLGQNNGHRRRQKIIENCLVKPSSSGHPELGNDRTMKSMKDVIRAVRNTLESKNTTPAGDDVTKFMSIQSSQNMIDYSIFRRQNQSKKPSFALRVLVQERLAEIIAIEVAGFHSSIDIKDYTLSVTFDSMSETAEKWSLPRRARKAFRAVAMEILYFVGEHGLITKGADALYELTPFEFHGLFSKLLAAMGDADVMEGWLAKTDALAMVDLQKAVLQRSAPDDEGLGGIRKRVFSIDGL